MELRTKVMSLIRRWIFKPATTEKEGSCHYKDVKSQPQLAKSDIQKKLKVGRLYVVESLAGSYKWLLFQCQQLQAAKRLHSCWFYNGNINVVLQEKGARNHVTPGGPSQAASLNGRGTEGHSCH